MHDKDVIFGWCYHSAVEKVESGAQETLKNGWSMTSGPKSRLYASVGCLQLPFLREVPTFRL